MSYEGAPRGCQDCHDEHAEGSGVDLERLHDPRDSRRRRGIFNAPTATPRRYRGGHLHGSRASCRTTSRPPRAPYDFYRADGKGICDNTECHGATWAAKPNGRPGPLSPLMGTSSANTNHSGGYRPRASTAKPATRHNDAQGGWGASASCDDCHGSAGFPNPTGIARTHTDANESLTYHDKHAGFDLIADCNDCHIHNGKTVSPGTGTHMDGTVNFGGPRLTTALNYTGSGYATVNCTARQRLPRRGQRPVEARASTAPTATTR